MALTNRQRVFVERYLTCWNATEAARQAGYSPRTAQEQGSRLLSNVMVKAAIDRRLAELKADADEIVLRLTDHARGSIEAVLDADNHISLSEARRRGKLHLVHKYKQTTRYDKQGNKTVTNEVELYDAQAAMVQLGRHRGIFVDKVAPTDPTGKHEYSDLTDEQRTARVVALLDRARARGTGPPDPDSDA